MKETSFIQQNKEKWTRFEKLYSSESNDPEELSNLYMDITDDLSYAQTFYKRRTVRVYLNQLAQKIYTGLQQQKGISAKKFLTVWQVSLPLEIYRSRKNLLFAFAAFLVYCAIGVVTTHFDHDFPRIVLGSEYVDLTLKNIRKGNPLGIYESQDQLSMFIQITTNNLKVAFLTFFVGFFFTFGTHILLFYNGVMLGAFQYFFKLKGLLITSFLGIWIHGTFEISAIVLAGGAGITAGNGWLFPGSLTRMQSLQSATKRGLKIMLSLVPFIIGAGFLESYVTHNYQDLPEWSKWALIALSLALVVFFYVFYPIYVARKYPHLVTLESNVSRTDNQGMILLKIRSAGEVIADSFQFLRLHAIKISKIILSFVLPMAIVLIVLQDLNRMEDMHVQHWYDWAGQLNIMFGYDFNSTQDTVIAICWIFVLSLIFTAVFWSFQTIGVPFSYRSFFDYARKRFVSVLLGSIFIFSVIFILPWYLLMPALLLLPFFYLNGAVMALNEASFAQRLKKSFSFSRTHYAKTLGILFILLILVTLFVQPIAFVMSIHEGLGDKPLVRDLLDMVADFIVRVASEFTEHSVVFGNIFRQLIYLLCIFIVVPLLAVTMAFAYFSELEKRQAIGLKKDFLKFGKRDRYKERPVDYE